jgi:4-nitrophenyl phosphatase
MKQYSRLKTILLDMDGVLWHGSKPVLDIGLLFDRIQKMDIQSYCVTNNSTRSINYHLDYLEGFGVSLDPSQIITSAEATAAFLEGKFPHRGILYVIGEEGIKEALETRGFQVLDSDSDNEPLAVVVGCDREFTYRHLDQAVRFIRRGALFVGTNPDLTFPTPTGPSPGAGTIIKAIEVAGGEAPYIIGKPYPTLYSLALSRANSLPEESLMIGDRLETDILGAQQLGLRTALVLSGITTREQAEDWDPAPDIIADSALHALDFILKNHG